MNTPSKNNNQNAGGFRGTGGRPRRRTASKRPTDEYKDQALEIRRVTRVVAGGKRFRFRATIAIGDLKGKVGVGVGKGQDVQSAIMKARVDAKKNVIRVPMKDTTIPHEIEAKFSAAKVRIKPAVKGHGLKAGGSVRAVLALAGVKDVVAKALGGTTNKLTNAHATIEALKKLKLKK